MIWKIFCFSMYVLKELDTGRKDGRQFKPMRTTYLKNFSAFCICVLIMWPNERMCEFSLGPQTCGDITDFKITFSARKRFKNTKLSYTSQNWAHLQPRWPVSISANGEFCAAVPRVATMPVWKQQSISAVFSSINTSMFLDCWLNETCFKMPPWLVWMFFCTFLNFYGLTVNLERKKWK